MENFPSKYQAANDSPGFLLWQITNLWQKHLRAALEEVNLTHVQFVLLVSLAYLLKHNQNVTQIQLAQHAKTDVMMTSQVVRTLEEKQFIQRTPSPTDTRAKSLTITPEGQAVAVRALKLVEAADAQFFAALDTNIGDFTQALQKLLNVNYH